MLSDMIMKMMHKPTISTLVLSLAFIPVVASAWTGPTATAPSGNVSAPINVSATSQLKNGSLGINALAVFGNSIFSANSYLNWGTTSGSSGYGIRDNAGTVEFKNSGGSWASMQSTIYDYCAGGGCGSGSPAWASITGKPYPVNGQTWNWSGQSGQPTWLWGSNDGTNMYAWNPSNFSVSYANSAGSAGSVPWSGVTGKTGSYSGTIVAGCASISVSGGLIASQQNPNYVCAGNDIAERYDTDGDIPVVRGLIVAYSQTTTTHELFVTNPTPGESTSTPYMMTTANVHVAKASEREQLLGAVPTTPFNISDQGKPTKPNTQLVSLVGHVPVHMTLDGGPIAIGDPITVSDTTPGYGMKATTAGRIIGYALAPYTGHESGAAGTDMVEVFIHVEDWQPKGALCASDESGKTCISKSDLDRLMATLRE